MLSPSRTVMFDGRSIKYWLKPEEEEEEEDP
jgi:hypothetical protein